MRTLVVVFLSLASIAVLFPIFLKVGRNLAKQSGKLWEESGEDESTSEVRREDS